LANRIEEREAQLIENIVGSVLSSVVKAQGLAASQLVEMIDKIGFEGKPLKTRMFEFDFVRSEIDPATNQIVRKRVTASVPLLTLINLPAIAIEEAIIEMDLQLVAHEREAQDGRLLKSPDQEPLKLYAVPARKQIVRSPEKALAVDAAGTIKMRLVMRQQTALGLQKVQSLLDSGSEENSSPEPKVQQQIAGAASHDTNPPLKVKTKALRSKRARR
jgi:hypothetical protein